MVYKVFRKGFYKISGTLFDIRKDFKDILLLSYFYPKFIVQ